jgi:hypothetical protein
VTTKRTASKSKQANATNFVKKLKKWGAELPAGERQLLEAMIKHAASAEVAQGAVKKGADIHISALVKTALAPNLKRVPRPWVRGGPAWIRRGAS